MAWLLSLSFVTDRVFGCAQRKTPERWPRYPSQTCSTSAGIAHTGPVRGQAPALCVASLSILPAGPTPPPQKLRGGLLCCNPILQNETHSLTSWGLGSFICAVFTPKGKGLQLVSVSEELSKRVEKPLQDKCGWEHHDDTTVAAEGNAR